MSLMLSVKIEMSFLNVYMCIHLNSYAGIVTSLNLYTTLHLMVQFIYTPFQEQMDKKIEIYYIFIAQTY